MYKKNSNCSALLTACLAFIVQLGLLIESASAEATNRSQTKPVVAACPVPPYSALPATCSFRQSRISIGLKQNSLNASIGELFQLIPVLSYAQWIRVDVATRPGPNAARLVHGRSPPNCVNALQ